MTCSAGLRIKHAWHTQKGLRQMIQVLNTEKEARGRQEEERMADPPFHCAAKKKKRSMPAVNPKKKRGGR